MQKQIEQECFWQLRGGSIGSMTADLKSTIVNNKQQNGQKQMAISPQLFCQEKRNSFPSYFLTYFSFLFFFIFTTLTRKKVRAE